MVLAVTLIFVFVVGAAVGSFLNVCIARLPLEKSLIWPSSRCGNCQQAIAWYDNLPLISYLWLRGRCRSCGQGYSIAYFFVELGVGLGFVGLFYLEVVENVHRWPIPFPWAASQGFYPWTSWVGFAWHALLFSFLVTASVCDLQRREIPLSLTMTGALVGLVGSAFLPWPWPHADGDLGTGSLREGVYAWPFWHPLPAWADPGGNWQTGLTTGVIGALVGTFLLRTIGFVFSAGLGKESLGLGDADLMLMAGAFLGWQIVVVAFFLSVIPALLFGIVLMIAKNDNTLPFGPSLALSLLFTRLAWEPIGAFVSVIFFWGEVLFLGALACAGLMFVSAFVIRVLRGREEPEA